MYCIIVAYMIVYCKFYMGHQKLLHDLPLVKSTCFRQVALDKRFLLNSDILHLYGFDSIRILLLSGDILKHTGDAKG